MAEVTTVYIAYKKDIYRAGVKGAGDKYRDATISSTASSSMKLDSIICDASQRFANLTAPL